MSTSHAPDGVDLKTKSESALGTTIRPTLGSAVGIAASALAAIRVQDRLADLMGSQTVKAEVSHADRVFAVSIGKAAEAMQIVFETECSSSFTGGLSVSHHASAPHRSGCSSHLVGAHPIPDASSQRAGQAVVDFLNDIELGPRDLVLVGISGGASALACLPKAPLTNKDLGSITRELMRSGIDVTEINQVRQSLVVLGGGGLADAIWPARCLSFILVDNVQIGAPAVGSGPTYPALGRTQDAWKIIQDLDLPSALKKLVGDILDRGGVERKLDRTENFVVSDPSAILDAANNAASAQGYTVISLTDSLQGEAREVAKALGSIYRHHARCETKLCVVAAGEVTVRLPQNSSGEGGRCQELAWAMIPEISSMPGAEFAAFATDGQDFVPGVGGARVTSETQHLLHSARFDWHRQLEKHETYRPLQQVGCLLPGSQTGNNICDLYVFIKDTTDGEVHDF